jgi:microcystin-dependent protein
MDGEYYLGQTIVTGFDVVPKNLAPCHGLMMPVSVCQTLTGTRYGSDGMFFACDRFLAQTVMTLSARVEDDV